jgi:hypothetical protein
MTEMTPETLRIEAGGMSTELGRRRVISAASAWEGDHKIALAAQAVANTWRQGEDQPYVTDNEAGDALLAALTMNNILTPKEVDAYRKIPHADFGVFRYSVLVATIDALVEALLLADQATEDRPDPKNCGCRTAYWLRSESRARVAAWLEET